MASAWKCTPRACRRLVSLSMLSYCADWSSTVCGLERAGRAGACSARQIALPQAVGRRSQSPALCTPRLSLRGGGRASSHCVRIEGLPAHLPPRMRLTQERRVSCSCSAFELWYPGAPHSRSHSIAAMPQTLGPRQANKY